MSVELKSYIKQLNNNYNALPLKADIHTSKVALNFSSHLIENTVCVHYKDQ
jgi:hypothetical protein